MPKIDPAHEIMQYYMPHTTLFTVRIAAYRNRHIESNVHRICSCQWLYSSSSASLIIAIPQFIDAKRLSNLILFIALIEFLCRIEQNGVERFIVLLHYAILTHPHRSSFFNGFPFSADTDECVAWLYNKITERSTRNNEQTTATGQMNNDARSQANRVLLVSRATQLQEYCSRSHLGRKQIIQQQQNDE